MIVSAINLTMERIEDHVEQTIIRPGETLFEGEILSPGRLERLIEKFPQVRFDVMPERPEKPKYSNRFDDELGHLEDSAAWILRRIVLANPEGARRLCKKIDRLLSGEGEDQIAASDLVAGPNTVSCRLISDVSENEWSTL